MCKIVDLMWMIQENDLYEKNSRYQNGMAVGDYRYSTDSVSSRKSRSPMRSFPVDTPIDYVEELNTS